MKQLTIHLNKEKGLTLIELLAALALLVVVVSLVVSFLKEGMNLYQSTVNTADVQLSLRHLQERIHGDIRSSGRVTKAGITYPYVDNGQLHLFFGEKERYLFIYLLEGENLVRLILNDQLEEVERKVMVKEVRDFRVAIEKRVVHLELVLKPNSPQEKEKLLTVVAFPRGKRLP